MPVPTPPTIESPSRRRGDAGASLVEYAVLVAVIAAVCVVAVIVLGHGS